MNKNELLSKLFLLTYLVIILLVLVSIEYIFNRQPKINKEIEISIDEIIHGDKSKQQVIFTFDGGSIDSSTLKVLDVLDKHKVRGTFFLTGKFVENNYKIVREIKNRGHEIFNHTYDHPYLTQISDDDITRELKMMDETMIRLIGIDSGSYFRPPYGDRDQRVLRKAYESGYQSVFWSVDALDWQEDLGITADTVKNIVLSTLKPGNIYLMHLGDKITGNILDELFLTIESMGYKIVSLKQGL